MAIFSVSDIVITITLLVNALALVSSKRQPVGYQSVVMTDKDDESFRSAEFTVNENDGSRVRKAIQTSSVEDLLENEEKLLEEERTMIGRFQLLVVGIRKYSCIIVLWNLFFMVLMVFVFGNE